MQDDIEELNFEEALAKLDEIVGQLEEGDLTLEQSLLLFEQGQILAGRCTSLLESAKLKVESLTADGEVVDIEVE